MRTTSRIIARVAAFLILCVVAPFAQGRPAGPPKEIEVETETETADVDDDSFGMTAPIICSRIDGYEDFDKRSNKALTKDEKLLLYFRPRHYKSREVGKKHQAHLTEDVRIRKKGEKTVIWSKEKLADYKATYDDPQQSIYLRNTISLKPLKPGDYEIDLILHDEIGRSAPGLRTVAFTVVESTAKPVENEGPERPAERSGPR